VTHPLLSTHCTLLLKHHMSANMFSSGYESRSARNYVLWDVSISKDNLVGRINWLHLVLKCMSLIWECPVLSFTFDWLFGSDRKYWTGCKGRLDMELHLMSVVANVMIFRQEGLCPHHRVGVWNLWSKLHHQLCRLLETMMQACWSYISFFSFRCRKWFSWGAGCCACC